MGRSLAPSVNLWRVGDVAGLRDALADLGPALYASPRTLEAIRITLEAVLEPLEAILEPLEAVLETLEAIRITLEAVLETLEAICCTLEAAIERFRSFEAAPRPSREVKKYISAGRRVEGLSEALGKTTKA